jgi:hypothetical protein
MAKSSKNSLAGKLGKSGAKAVKKHRGNETTSPGSGGSVPSGVRNGVAKITHCKFEVHPSTHEYYPNEYFLSVRGIAVEPKATDANEPVEGLIVFLPSIHLCTTSKGESYEKTLETNIDRALNLLRQLGEDTEDVEMDELEGLAASILKREPCFKFSTATKYDKVLTFFNGLTDEPDDEFADDDDDDDDVDDDEDEDDDDIPFESDDDDDDDSDDDEDSDSDDDEEDEEEEEFAPEKGDVYGYKPKGKRKPLDCTVTAVFVKKETCNLKSITDDKVHKGVPWVKLLDLDE